MSSKERNLNIDSDKYIYIYIYIYIKMLVPLRLLDYSDEDAHTLSQ